MIGKFLLISTGLLACSMLGSCADDPATEQAQETAGNQAGEVAQARVSKVPPPSAAPAVVLSQNELLYRFRQAGLEFEPREKTRVYPSDYEKFPEEPRSMVTIHLGDGQGNATNVTLVEFSDTEAPSLIRGVNGFAVHNWFFLGTTSNFFRDLIREAL